MLDKHIFTLNPQQKEAVTHREGPLLVLAGAGSGKTRVVTLRMAYLISQGVEPYKILGVTFTNRAAREMKERVEKFIDSSVLVCTFHSLGVRILRESIRHLGYTKDFVIYDDDDTDKLIRACAKEIGVPQKFDLGKVKNYISTAKNNLKKNFETKDPEQAVYAAFFERYIKKLRENNAVDFDDLLYLPVELFRLHPEVLSDYQDRWHYIMVDEYQDTNNAQYHFVQLLAHRHKNLCIVGDPDQSIYSWRGANLNNILNFERDWHNARVIRLEQNYRSTQSILDAANALIANNKERLEKKLWSSKGEGQKITIFAAKTERQEAIYVAEMIQKIQKEQKKQLKDFVVFYRTNAQSRILEDELLTRKISYTIFGGISFYLRREIKDILSYLKLLENPYDTVSFLRCINLPKRGFGEVLIENIFQSRRNTESSILEYLQQVVSSNFSEINYTINARQKEGWKSFVGLMNKLEALKNEGSLKDLVYTAVFDSGYMDVLNQEEETKVDRLENLEQLILKAEEWQESKTAEERSLAHFLEEVTLSSTLDENEKNEDRISMMTLHNGKGLEFPVAFVIGIEEDLLPHINSKNKHEQIEEERRLFYVGITRAQEELYLSCSSTRVIWGSERLMRPSRFLHEIPEHLRVIEKNLPRTNIAQVETPIASKIFKAGDMVLHPEFGPGRVENVQYTSSLGYMYDVQFLKDRTPKKLVAKFAPLSSIEE